jgi:A/G-specific adenine glycosylase
MKNDKTAAVPGFGNCDPLTIISFDMTKASVPRARRARVASVGAAQPAAPTSTVTSTEVAEKFHRPTATPSRSRRAHHAHAEPGSQSVPGPDPAPETVRLLQTSLLTWYARERRSLPWRATRDPYAIWLSEVMLQQTRVDTVIPYYERFLARWPTVSALAEAPIDEVLASWSGLGYYRRARMLHAAAQAIAAESEVPFPPDAESLARVKGIGRYTAGAVASIAYGEAVPLVDGNVARVFARLFAIDQDVRSTKGVARLWALAESLVAAEDPGAWNQALMELGATVCVPRDPRCLLCPVQTLCRARAEGTERELPHVKAKPKARVQRRWALVATKGAAVLLGQRRADARFGGLWEPPTLDALPGEESDEEAAARLASMVGATLQNVMRAPDVTHVLSHRRLEISVVRAELARAPAASAVVDGPEYTRFVLVDAGQLHDRGVSTLARKLLAAGLPDRKNNGIE